MIQMVTKAVALFRADNGKVLAFLAESDLKNGDVLSSSDGTKFYALGVSGGGNILSEGVLPESMLSIDNPRFETHDMLTYIREAEVIIYEAELYSREKGNEFELGQVIPLPSTRRPEYLFQTDDGTLLYVSSDKFSGSYESFKLFIGDGKEMREIPVKSVDRYRDGGTTIIITDEGRVFSPTPNSPNDPPSWGQDDDLKWLTKLSLEDFDIVETPDGQVTIAAAN